MTSSNQPQSRQHGPWQIVESNQVYRDPWMSVRCDEVIRPDGKPGTHSVATIKPGVSVLAIDANRNVYLTKEFHYAVGRITLETVSGGIEAGEGGLETAQRELREELGITAKQWTDVGMCDPFTASVLSPSRLYIARDLSFGSQDLEGTEQIQSVKMSLNEAVEAVMQSEITHAASALLIMKARHILSQPGI